MNKGISAKKTIIYILIFIGLIALTVGAILRGHDFGELWQVVRNTQGIYLYIAMVFSLSFVFFEAANLQRILGVLKYKVPYYKTLKYAFAGYFFSAITPSATGGQPMQVYVMARDEIEISHGSIALLIELLCFQGAACIYGLVASIMGIIGIVEVKGYILIMALCGCGLSMGMLVFLSIGIFSKNISSRLMNFMLKMADRFPVVREERKEKFKSSTKEHFAEYEKCSQVMQRNLGLIPKVLGLLLIQFACQFGISYLIYLALGQNTIGLGTILTLQAIAYIATFFVPIPGAVGAAEGVFVLVFSKVYLAGMVSAAMILARGISFYIPVLICGVVTLIWIGKNIFGRNKKLEKMTAL